MNEKTFFTRTGELSSLGFKIHDATESYFSNKYGKYISHQALQVMTNSEFRSFVDAKAPSDEFWFVSYDVPDEAQFEETISRVNIGVRKPVAKALVRAGYSDVASTKWRQIASRFASD